MSPPILKRPPRGHCVMPPLARIFFIASVAASCSVERAQQEADRKEIGRQLTAAYYSCVRTSFASMLPTMVDRNMPASLFAGNGSRRPIWQPHALSPASNSYAPQPWHRFIA